jgi:hypothetical protein
MPSPHPSKGDTMGHGFFYQSQVERAEARLSYAKREHGAFAARCDRSDPIALRTLRKFEGR